MSVNSMDGNVTVADEEALAPPNFWPPRHRPDLFTWITYSPGPTIIYFDQDPVNPSHSQEGTSVANGHVPYQIRSYNNNGSQRADNGSINSHAIPDLVTTEEGSIFSYRPSKGLSTFLCKTDGRTFNNHPELHFLSSDYSELQRLYADGHNGDPIAHSTSPRAKQHYSISLCMGGLTPCPGLVDQVLNPANRLGPNFPVRILDLGCGTGIWTIEMALQYPHASITGVDLSPVAVDMSKIPPNCRFEIDDFTLGLSHYHNRFDVVHLRCIAGGIPNFDVMMQDVEACLKPSGVVIFMDGDPRIYLEDDTTPAPVAVDEDEPGGPIEGSWFHRIAREVRYALAHDGVDIERSETAMDAGLWDHPLIDKTTVQVGGIFTPIGPWASASDLHQRQRVKYAGSLMRQDCMHMIRARYPLLKLHGIPEDRLQLWTKRAEDELEKMTYHMSFHWRVTWGRRHPVPPQSGLAPHSMGGYWGSGGH